MSLKRTFIASALMILTALCYGYIGHQERVRPSKPFSTFPTEISGWTGKQMKFDQDIVEDLGVDDYLLAAYRNSTGKHIQVYAGFYQSQKEGDLIHSPRSCLPGVGWKIIRRSYEDFTLTNSGPEEIRVNKLVIEKDDNRNLVLYWFQSRGRFIASEYMQKIYLIADSMTKRRTDGTFVRLIAPIINGDEIKATEDLTNFARLFIPILKEHVPS